MYYSKLVTSKIIKSVKNNCMCTYRYPQLILILFKKILYTLWVTIDTWQWFYWSKIQIYVSTTI